MQKWRLFSLSAQKYDCCAPAIPPHHLERQSEGRGMSSRPVLTAALPLTEWPQTPTLGPVPSFFFFYTNTCPSCLGTVAIGNQTPESELRKPHPVSQACLRKGGWTLTQNWVSLWSHPPDRQTDPFIARKLTVEVSEWHIPGQRQLFGTVVSEFRDLLRWENGSYRHFSPERKTGMFPYIIGLEAKSRDTMKPGPISLNYTHGLSKTAFKLLLVSVCIEKVPVTGIARWKSLPLIHSWWPFTYHIEPWSSQLTSFSTPKLYTRQRFTFSLRAE